jgi:hypothetical protein
MRRLAAILILSAAFAGPALMQAAHAQPYPPPPPPRAETVPPPPGTRYVWEPGHWHWNGATYVWVGGHYVIRQARWHEYVPGHWQQNPYGQWVWVAAHWR